MRRIIYPLLAGIALLGVAVTPALARQHDHRAHERRHHERRHHERRHHHARIRHRTFGSAAGTSGTTSTSNDNAGTVSSFTNGVLTITLHDGSMVSGAVNRDTKIECRGNGARGDQDPGDNDAGENAGERAHDARSGGGDSSGRDDNPGAGDEAQGENDNPGDDDNNDNNNDEMQNCSSSALTHGTVVREAELAVGSGGARWDKVELLGTATNGGEDS
ncbi:MAG TPA: hypothetical protein VGG87_08910 [Solirubrobacteraceae bacterium]|jgi:hypothetical protein